MIFITVKVVIYAGSLLRVFYGRPKRLRIEYSDEFFNHTKVLNFLPYDRGYFKRFKANRITTVIFTHA